MCVCTRARVRVLRMRMCVCRAARLDEVSGEVLKLGSMESVKWMKALADRIWAEEAIPEDWRKQLIVPLHKKGC